MKQFTGQHLFMLIFAATGVLSSAEDQPIVDPESVAGHLQTGTDNEDAYYDLGGFHRAVTSSSEQAQVWFDRGLAMCFAFNHEEAVRCFEHALEEDPSMAMALWGLAYAWGPNINYLDIPSDQMAQASAVLRLAQLYGVHATSLEQDLIAALAQRHAIPVPEDRQPLNKAYAEAMRYIYQNYSNDFLVAAVVRADVKVDRSCYCRINDRAAQ